MRSENSLVEFREVGKKLLFNLVGIGKLYFLYRRDIFSMCGIHKSQRGGSATLMLQKMLRCTGGRGGFNKKFQVAQKKLEISKSIKKVDYVPNKF